MNSPLSESGVSLILSLIQKRSSELEAEPESMTELCLEDSESKADVTDLYDLQR